MSKDFYKISKAQAKSKINVDIHIENVLDNKGNNSEEATY